MIGHEIKNVEEEKYNLLFFADIMSDGSVSTHDYLPAELIHRNGKPSFLLGGKIFELGSIDGYDRFWRVYDRPPKKQYRNYLLERRDSLIPLDERQFKGAYYTPLDVVGKAYDYLSATLGEKWQKDYVVWDMCCGVGNLETKHSNPRNLYMSTLDQSDVDIMRATRTCVGAERFAYDYLNDDITDSGEIDYTLTNKVPLSLQSAIRAGKKILVLINPPYAETTNADNSVAGRVGKNKTGVKRTKMASVGMPEYGKASNELFLQFVARIAKEIPTAVVGMFSKMKFINAQASEDFRQVWNACYLNGFVVHSRAFDGIHGDFPIGFTIWKTDNRRNSKRMEISEVACDVYDRNLNPIGSKTFYNLPVGSYLSKWIRRPRANKQLCVPLSSALNPPVGERRDQRGTKWSDGAIGYLVTGGNELQNQKYITVLSSGASRGHGIYVNEDNLLQCAVYFTVTRIVRPTWLNDRDQFLQPSDQLEEEFMTDCLVWMLFNGANNTASADGLEWNGRIWSIVNHFIPFSEVEVDAPERFESDFMVRFMENLVLSAEADAVMKEGRKLWIAYFSKPDEYLIRRRLRFNRPDVGWYQVRSALQARNEHGNGAPVDFAPFKSAYDALTRKLLPEVYRKGFLRN